jgi:hypothetical protein
MNVEKSKAFTIRNGGSMIFSLISTYLNRSQAPGNDDGHVASKSRAVGSRSDGSNHVKNRFCGHCSSTVHILFATVHTSSLCAHEKRTQNIKNKSFSFVENFKENLK